jgi:decaprenyl-phosphate phosphoribosyltransferase
MKVWLSEIRVRQWKKQILIFLPIISLGDSIRLPQFLHVFSVALAFSLAASSIYLYNDYIDVNQDKLDSLKSKRPFAAGLIKSSEIRAVGILLLVISVLISYVFSPGDSKILVTGLILLYLLLNLIYSTWKLKRIKILGLVIVSSGFPIRFTIGSLVLGLNFSVWGFVLVMQLAMFMLAGKRYQSILRVNPKGPNLLTRDIELQFWLFVMVTLGSLVAATYTGFTADQSVIDHWGKQALIFSILPLGLGLIRYVELVMHPSDYELIDSTEKMTKDIFLLGTVAIFLTVLFVGRYHA